MIISEFLPNPAGKDTEGEWIKFLNDKTEPVDLRGWSIKDTSGKIFKFTKEILVEPGGYFQLNYSQSKISINNNGEELFLYDASGVLADKAQYAGTAPEGKSLIRYGDVFSFPREEKNDSLPAEAVIERRVDYSQATVLNPGQGFNASVLLICFSIILILSAVFIYIFKNISEETDADF